MIYLLMSLAMAPNYANEGMFMNNSSQALQCMKDIDGRRWHIMIEPGQICKGDGVLLSTGKVFKIPNETTFVCGDETCEANDLVSWLIMHYAMHSRGSAKYGEMDLMWFEGIMGW